MMKCAEFWATKNIWIYNKFELNKFRLDLTFEI